MSTILTVLAVVAATTPGLLVTPPLVSHCLVGRRASVTYVVARHLGYDARMYDGAIEDWTARKLPVKTGR